VRSARDRALYPLGTSSGLRPQLVLPESHYAYALFAEHPGCLQVSLAIAVDLRSPECRVLSGVVAAQRAPVPEAAVHEDRDRRGREEEIW
jgi:hypothetical protein